MSEHVLVCGAGGFIGGHLVKHLLDQGKEVRAVDIKPAHAWFQRHGGAENRQADLRNADACHAAVKDIAWVYNLAADMGGMGFIENNKALCMLSVLINTHLLMACRKAGTQRYFFASSACVYSAYMQDHTFEVELSEEDAYPAMPEDGYGWEKLFSERMCRHFREDFGLETRVARFHNVYGPNGTYDGGREKAPAAICRKVIQAIRDKERSISIWGDGEQVRSFMWIEDCLHGIDLIMNGRSPEPINLGSSESVTINRLVDIVEAHADVKLMRTYDTSAPQGVRGRSSDNTLIRTLFNWEPKTPLREGMARTYDWIKEDMQCKS